MANINVTTVYEQLGRTFRNPGVTRFEQDFISAFNMTTRIINRRADLETAIDMIDGTSGTIGLDDVHYDVLVNGLMFNLAHLGHRPEKGMENAVAESEERFHKGIESLWFYVVNQKQHENGDDDATNDIIGLGKLGA
jgi:hypothetical protein